VRRILSWISGLIVLPILAAVVTFSLHNKLPMGLNLWPFGLVIELPIYLALFAAMIVGVVVGGTAAWLGQGRVRSSLRDQAYDGEVARRELKAEREKVVALDRELKTLKATASPAPKSDVVIAHETTASLQRLG